MCVLVFKLFERHVLWCWRKLVTNDLREVSAVAPVINLPGLYQLRITCKNVLKAYGIV